MARATSSPRKTAGQIRIGIGGWTFAPWRGGVFYPKGLAQARELEHASRALTSIEINGTFYGAQKPESFARWHDETPDDFVFALKGPRFATNRRVLAEAGPSMERFVTGGLLQLKRKLGPINWQLAPTKKLDVEDFAAFLRLLPASHEGVALRHAVEVRHESFMVPECVAAAREAGVALVVAGDAKYPLIPDPTAPFVYARIMGTTEDAAKGYAPAALDAWARRAQVWAAGGAPEDLKPIAPAAAVAPKGKAKTAAAAKPRDVFLYVISGAKEKNPAAAMALIERVRKM